MKREGSIKGIPKIKKGSKNDELKIEDSEFSGYSSSSHSHSICRWPLELSSNGIVDEGILKANEFLKGVFSL
jgi:hypothetical protein